MDSSATSKAGEGRTGRICSGLCFCVISYLVVSFLTSFLLGLLGLAIDRFSASAAVAIPTTCRILSSGKHLAGVDLKASKVCQLGTLNHKANGAFYHLKKATFRCHYDYYWASIFEVITYLSTDMQVEWHVLNNLLQVQFEEYFSGQIFHAVAEVPKEALPHDCRPDFGIAWLTTLKFKVNETYGCWLQLCISHDIRVRFILLVISVDTTKSCGFNRLMGLFIEVEGPGSNIVYVARGFVCGFLVSMLTVATAECFRILAGAMARRQTCIVWLQRVCIIVAYFSAMAWLILQYGKMIGLNQLLFDSKTYERTS
ncbi:hypothetical protein ZIOFF_035931 [Zingiber officinale]|uniref:Uncharacterized protein n=1 Tax=Zingiber officinale TaxID=94328 RepID=A0A8J5GCJ6_ZINOF|nr:hypothetical protein ZIOFF_035931 [Zingiber officinale]